MVIVLLMDLAFKIVMIIATPIFQLIHSVLNGKRMFAKIAHSDHFLMKLVFALMLVITVILGIN
jgi:hypothetical protein